MTMLKSLDRSALVAWVESTLRTEIRSIEVLPGATTSTLLRLELRQKDDIVARVYTNEAFYREVPDRIAHEFTALHIAHQHLPAPCPLAYHADAQLCGAPVLLMTALPGTVRTQLMTKHLRKLAEMLRGIHALPTDDLKWRYATFTQAEQVSVPDWASSPALWRHAVEIFHARPPLAPAVLLHRDYHPTNILWDAGEIAGVVDWGYACRGPAGADVAHCKLNLALMLGAEAANTFVAAYGSPLHQYWDINAILGALPAPCFYPPWAEFGLAPLRQEQLNQRLEAYLAAVLT